MKRIRQRLSRAHGHQLVTALRLVRERHPQVDLRSIEFTVAQESSSNIFAHYRSPDLIVYSPTIKIEDMLWVTVHEIGHFVDYNLSPGNKKYGSETDLLDPWRLVTESTQGYGCLRSYYQDYLTRHNQEQSREEWRRKINHLRYLLRSNELWARAYTQWVLTGTEYEDDHKRVTNSLLRRGIHEVAAHWLDYDYKPLGKEMDRLLLSQLGNYTIGPLHTV